tara:strand:- start:22527 stop:22841 length:315 start_codon:yes stop_codon:yes gene_type:complete
MEKSTISRRGFLRLSVAAAGMAATGTGFSAIKVATSAPAITDNETWTELVRAIAAGLGTPYKVLAGQCTAHYQAAFTLSEYREAWLAMQSPPARLYRTLDGESK